MQTQSFDSFRSALLDVYSPAVAELECAALDPRYFGCIDEERRTIRVAYALVRRALRAATTVADLGDIVRRSDACEFRDRAEIVVGQSPAYADECADATEEDPFEVRANFLANARTAIVGTHEEVYAMRF